MNVVCVFVDICFVFHAQNLAVKEGKVQAASGDQPLLSEDQEEFYIPSVDLLTAQVISSVLLKLQLLVSIELLSYRMILPNKQEIFSVTYQSFKLLTSRYCFKVQVCFILFLSVMEVMYSFKHEYKIIFL